MRLALAILIPFLSLLPWQGSAAIPVVDMYLDMEAGSSGANITTDLLNAATHGNAGVWSLWPENASSLSAFEVSTAYDENVGSVIAGGTTYADHGYRTFAFRNVTHPQFARYTFTTRRSKVSIGCYLRLGSFTGTTYGSYDLIAMEGNDGDFAVVNFQDFPDEFVWEVHTHNGVGQTIPIVANKTYWVTMLWDKPNLMATLKIYDPLTWLPLGTSSLGLADEFCETVCFGRYDDHDYTPALFHYYDDLMVDLTQATFPLLPALNREPISLTTVGAGTITGATNSAFLQVGSSYALTAKPAPGNLFVGWSGSVTSSSATVRFVMASNFALTATFVTNHFPSVKGTYNGLFYNSADTRQESSGYATITVNGLGSYSGKLTLNARTYGFHGKLAPDTGLGQQTIVRPGTNALKMQLSLDLTGQSDRLDGLVTEEISDTPVWSADLALDRATFSKTNPSPDAGRYTLYIPPDANAPAGPAGKSVGTLTLASSGGLTISCVLADGTKTARKTTLSKGGLAGFYAPLYKDKGSLLSPVQFDASQPTTDLAGPLVWFKQAQPLAKYYPEGFTNSSQLLGSRYVAPIPSQPALSHTNARLDFVDPQTLADFSNEIVLSPQSTILNQSTNKLSVSLTKATGMFQGSVTPPWGGKPLPFKGVIFQKQDLGAGFVMGTNQTGMLLLAPETP